MRHRRLAIFAALAALLCVALLLGLWYDKAPKGRPRVRSVLPGMTVRGDGSPGEGQPATRAEDAAFATVVCRVDTEGDPGSLRATGEAGAATSIANGNDLVLTLEPGSWSLRWEAGEAGGGGHSGFFLGTWELVAGDTRACVLTPDGVAVSGDVVDTSGQPVPGAWVVGCGDRLVADESGHFAGSVYLGRSGRCSLRARFADGALARFGEAVEVDAFGANTPIDLVVDAEPVAGLGIGFDVVPIGIRVTRVIPNSPAWAAGLEVGDIIYAVDGQSVVGVDSYTFLTLGTGPEGSTVRLGVRYGDVGEEITFRRGRIPSDG
jgi:hypothetical protein